MSNRIESSGVRRVRSLVVIGLLAGACAPGDHDQDGAAELAVQRLAGEASDVGAGAEQEDDLVPADEGGSIRGVYFTGQYACEGKGSGVIDFWGPSSQVSLAGDDPLVVTNEKPMERIPCLIRLDVQSVQGIQWAVTKVAHRGALRLAEGSKLAMTTYFTSQDKQLEAITLLEDGPSQRSFETERTIPPSQRVWSACGAGLDVVVMQAATVDEGAPAQLENQLLLPATRDDSPFTVTVGARRCTPPG